MYLTKQEDMRNRTISATVAASIFSLIVLFFIVQTLVTPNPPFPKGGSSSYAGLTFATMENSRVNYDQMGTTTDAVAKEEVLTSENNEVPFAKTEKIKTLSAVQQLALNYKNNSAKTTNGKSEDIGKQDGPEGSETYNTNTNEIAEPKADQTGFKVDLLNSKLLYMPSLPKDIGEEGKVVVNITVNALGAVIDAEAGGRGTTTSSAVLRSKARQAALATKFNADSKNPERRGSITIIFAFE
jgi:protein TonB